MSSFKFLDKVEQPESESVCDRMWLLLSVYCDGEASPDEFTEVERHTAECPACAAELAMMQANATVLAALPEIEPPAALRTAILAATVNRPSFAARFAQALRTGLVVHPVRYGALATAGAAAAMALTVMGRRPAEIPVPVAFTQQPPAVIAEAPAAKPPIPSAEAMGSLAAARPNRHLHFGEPRRRAVDAPRYEIADGARIVTADVRGPRVPAQTSNPSVPPSVRTASAVPAYKIKLPTSRPNRDTSEVPESTESAPIEVASAAGMGTPAKPITSVAAAPEAAAPSPASTRIMIAASASGIPVDQMASLAVIKENIRRQKPAWDTRAVAQSIKDRQIRIDLIRGSF